MEERVLTKKELKRKTFEENVLRGRSIGGCSDQKHDRSERVFVSNAALNRMLARRGMHLYTPREHLAVIEAQYEITDEQRLIIMAMIRGTGQLKRRDGEISLKLKNVP